MGLATHEPPLRHVSLKHWNILLHGGLPKPLKEKNKQAVVIGLSLTQNKLIWKKYTSWTTTIESNRAWNTIGSIRIWGTGFSWKMEKIT